MSDDVIVAFRRRLMSEGVVRVRAESGTVRLVPDTTTGDPPRQLHGLFLSLERLVCDADGAFHRIDAPLPFTLDFPDDYCCCSDGSLQMRVARLGAPMAHPNVGPGGMVCLGPRFRPATRLPQLLEHLHRICSSRTYASESPFDAKAADFFRRHPERIRSLRSAPLWRRPVAGQIEVTSFQRCEQGCEPGAGQ